MVALMDGSSDQVLLAGKPNEHIAKFLEYYWNEHDSDHFNYAVLIDGDWGVGKTYLVNEIISALSSQKQKTKHESKGFFRKPQKLRAYDIRVSLFGLRSVEEIASSILIELLKARYPSFATGLTLAQGAAKGIANVASVLAGIGKTGGELVDGTSGVIGSILNDKLVDTAELIFVLDDLERCQVPLVEVMGYVSLLVERSRYKVIIVANVAEISFHKDDGNDYKEEFDRTKEKIVGKYFKVQPDTDHIVDAILADGDWEEYIDVSFIKELLIDLCVRDNITNFRALKITVSESRLFLQAIDKHFIAYKPAMQKLIYLFCVLRLHVQLGSFVETDWNDVAKTVTRLSVKIRNNDSIDEYSNGTCLLRELQERHSVHLNFYRLILSEDLWGEILFGGAIDSNRINSELRDVPEFAPEEEPIWYKVWMSYEQDDIVFENSTIELSKQIKQIYLTKAGEILHVVGLSIWIRDVIYPSSELWQQIVDDWPEYFQDLANCNQIPGRLPEQEHRAAERDVFFGRGVFCRETSEYQQIKKVYIDHVERSYIIHLREFAIGLLDVLANDGKRFYNYVGNAHAKDDGSWYYNVPLLRFIPPWEFADALQGLPASQFREVMAFFKDRYDFHNWRYLSIEKDWCFRVLDILQEYADSHDGIAGARVRNALELYGIHAKASWDAYDLQVRMQS
ncbi:KAP family P-loop domain protein [Pseudovibrio sp. Ad37]|nr:KAP family P-loop domain protein [Pseudovibrio sp. Ad37]